MKKLVKVSALGFLVLLPWTAKLCRADILFLDMNDSPAEIRAAEEAAARMNPPQKVIVFPERTPAQQKTFIRIHELMSEQNHVSSAAMQDYRNLDADRVKLQRMTKAGSVSQDVVNKIQEDENKWADKMNQDFSLGQDKVNAINQKILTLSQNLPPFDYLKLQKLIDSYHGSKNKITSVIFSGHHDFETFTGIYSIGKQQLVDMFKKDPDVYQGVRAVYGWGCYSATPEEGIWWNDMFPNKGMLAGFDAGGPSSDQPADREWLEGVMLHQERVLQVADNAKTAHDVRLIQGMVHAIPGWGIANTALCTRAVCVGLNTGAIDLSKVTDLCTQQNLDYLSTISLRVSVAMQAASKSCEDVPCDGQHSWLRDYYNKLRSLQHCGIDLSPLTAQFAAMTQQADQVIRLIDFGEIFNNFRSYYKTDIDRMNKIQNSCGNKLPDLSGELKCTAPPPQPSDKKTITRFQIQQYVTQSSSVPNSCKLNPADSQFLTKMQIRLQTMVTGLQCIPLAWVNPPLGGRMPEAPDPKCIQ